MEVLTYVVCGLLEAGKTTYILSCLEALRGETEGKTLVVVLEEGEKIYPQELSGRGVEVLYFSPDPGESQNGESENGESENRESQNGESQKEGAHYYLEGSEGQEKGLKKSLKDCIQERVLSGDIARVFVETNAFGPGAELPGCLKVASRLTIIDASALKVQYRNLFRTFQELVGKSDTVVFNRVCSPKSLSSYGDGFRVMNPKARFLRERCAGEPGPAKGEEGLFSLPQAFARALPYDREAPRLCLSPEDFLPWFLDLRENPGAYEGKEVEILLQADPRFPSPEGCIQVGRLVMTCCILDIQFLSLPCLLEVEKRPKRRQWMRLLAQIWVGEEGQAYLKALEMKEEAPPRESILTGGEALFSAGGEGEGEGN